MEIVLGILIPFFGTAIGSTMVFFMKNTLSKKVEKILLGFASGVMIAASIWSLIIPSIEMAESQNIIPWIPAVIGFILGIVFLLIIDCIVPHIEQGKIKGIKTKFTNTTMMVLAVTLHNIPEGMAVGVVFAGILSGTSDVTLTAAYALAIGIAIQNFPEGAIISMPLKSGGMQKKKAFICGVLSGIVEPIAALITVALTSIVTPLLPYLLAFAAGAMIYVVVDELIPESQKGELSNLGTIGVTIGFLIMMVLDVTLG